MVIMTHSVVEHTHQSHEGRKRCKLQTNRLVPHLLVSCSRRAREPPVPLDGRAQRRTVLPALTSERSNRFRSTAEQVCEEFTVQRCVSPEPAGGTAHAEVEPSECRAATVVSLPARGATVVAETTASAPISSSGGMAFPDNSCEPPARRRRFN